MKTKLVIILFVFILCSACTESNDNSNPNLSETNYFLNININTNISNYILIIPLPIDIQDEKIFPEVLKDLINCNLNIEILNKTEKVNQQALCIHGNKSLNINLWGPLNKTDISFDLSQNVNTSLSNSNDFWFFLKTDDSTSIECSYSYLEINGPYYQWRTLKTNENNQIMNITINNGWNQYHFLTIGAWP